MGLLSFLFGGGQPQTPAPTPQAAQNPPGNVSDLLGQYLKNGAVQAQKPSLGDILNIVGATMSQASGANPEALSQIQQARQSDQQTQQGSAQRAALYQMARQLNLPPVQQLLFAADPDKWAETYGHRVNDYHAQAGGTTGYWGDPSLGGSQASAPSYGQEQGEGYTIRPGQMTDLGGLQMSPEQKQAAQDKADADAEKARHDQVLETIGLGNMGANQTRAAKYKSGGGSGSGLPAGVQLGW